MEVSLETYHAKPAILRLVETRAWAAASVGGMRPWLWRSARCICGFQPCSWKWSSVGTQFPAGDFGRGAGQLHTVSTFTADVALLRGKHIPSLGFPAVLGLQQVRCEFQEVRGYKSAKKDKKPIGKKVGAPRGPLWRTRKSISKEVVQAVQELKRARASPTELAQVFKIRVSRLLKVDLIGVLHELQRQDETDLALKVFEHIRKEAWYKPDLFLYRDLLECLGRNKKIEKVEHVWSVIESETPQPELVVWTELVGAYLRNDLQTKAVEAFERMRASGVEPDHFTYSILIKGLWKADEKEIASKYRDERMRAFPNMEASL